MRSLLVALALVATGCTPDSPPRPGGDESPDATGSLTIGRGTAPAIRMDLTDCWSGQMLSFYGFDIFEKDNVARRLRVVEDPVVGTRIVLLGVLPEAARIIVDEKACTVFQETLTPGSSYLNDVRSLTGSVTLDCTLPDGAGHLVAQATLNDCSFDNRAY